MDDKATLRARDFWTSLVLIALSLFFLLRTSSIPFLDAKAAGVQAAEWYNSAALVPYGIFLALLVLALGLLITSIRDGGAKQALSLIGIGFSKEEAERIGALSLILFFYIFGLVPRVDFIIASALMITCLIWGFHNRNRLATFATTLSMTAAALYAMVAHLPQAEWVKPHDDDVVALLIFLGLNALMFVCEARSRQLTTAIRVTPAIALVVPLILVLAMAFGFRQNVPNRSGLFFSKIEYHYYVTLKPLLSGER